MLCTGSCSVSMSVFQSQASMRFRDVCTLPGGPSACQGHGEGYSGRLLEVLPRLLVVGLHRRHPSRSSRLADPSVCR